jgi:hypothetical protein
MTQIPSASLPGSARFWADLHDGQMVGLVGTFEAIELKFTHQHRAYCTGHLRTVGELVAVFVWPLHYPHVVDYRRDSGTVHVIGRVDKRPTTGWLTVLAVAR